MISLRETEQYIGRGQNDSLSLVMGVCYFQHDMVKLSIFISHGK